MAYVFISYSKQDIDFARHLRDLLTANRISVWLDESRLAPSARWWTEIEDNIERCAALIVIMSPAARESDWVEREILYAERLEKPIFPVLLAGEDWPRLANLQYADMRAGQQAALPPSLEHQLRAVIALAPPEPSAVTAPDRVKPPRQLRRSRERTQRPRRRVGCLTKMRRVIIGLLVLAALVFLATDYDFWFGPQSFDDSSGDTMNGGEPNEREEPPAEVEEPEGGWFEEEFDSGMPRSGWDYSENWHANNSIAELGDGGFMFRPGDYVNMALHTRLNWETDEGQIGILFRSTEDLTFVFVATPNSMRLERATPQGASVFAEIARPLEPGWHNIIIHTIDGELEVLVDRDVIFAERIEVKGGGVGIFMDGYGWLQLDRFAVTPP